MSFLGNIRCPKQQMPLGRMVFHTIIIFLLGIALGIFSKYLDYQQGYLPTFLMTLDETFDLHNFFGRFSVWIAIAVCISVYSNSSIRAALNVFVFFAGMVSSYYWYSKFVAGFLPISYAMIWVGFTIISPLLAFICWYAKGSGHISLVLSSLICAVFFNMTYTYGWSYFDFRSILDAIVCICALVILKRSTIKETMIMIALGIVFAPILKMILPYQFQLW